MQNLNSTTIIYYTGSILLSIVFCLALMVTLSWPMLAEIPLSISIFIQLLAISRSIYNVVDKTETESLEEVYSRLKGGVFDHNVKEKSGLVEH